MRTETACKPRASVHPAEYELRSFMRSELPLAEALPIVRHMMAGCAECLKVTGPIWRLMEPAPKRPGGRR